MSYFRKDSKSWVATWTDKTGKSHRKSGFSSKKNADMFEARQKLLVETNLVYGVQFDLDMKINDLIEKYLWQLRLQVKKSSFETYKVFLQSIQKFLEDERIFLYQDLTAQVMYEYIQFRKDCGTSDITINSSIQSIKRVCKFAKESGIVKENLLDNFKKIRIDKQDDVRILSKHELSIIERLAEKSPNRDEFFFLVRTGCRVSEMISLEVDDIDFEKNRFKVSAKKSKSRATRYVPMTIGVKELIEKKCAAAKEKNKKYLFANRRGKKHSSNCIWKSFRTILNRAKKEGINIDGVRVHTLRSTYVSHMVMSGVDRIKIMKIVGHSSFQTMKKYLHLSEDYIQDVPEIF